MAQQPLIKHLLLIAPLVFCASFSKASTCRDVQVKSQSVKASEEVGLCFYNDVTYFLSRSCQDMNCHFIQQLKQTKPETSSEKRPGALLCQKLKGIIEEVTLVESRQTVQRCVFPEEKESISLNLLESWDGKKFRGPAPSLKL